MSTKKKIKEEEAREIISKVDDVYAYKGKKSLHINLKEEKLETEALKKFILGPTGNFRAPTIRKGKKLLLVLMKIYIKKSVFNAFLGLPQDFFILHFYEVYQVPLVNFDTDQSVPFVSFSLQVRTYIVEHLFLNLLDLVYEIPNFLT